MSEFLSEPSYDAVPLTRELAEQHLAELTSLANLIPGVEYSPEDILGEQKGDRALHAKWAHSMVVIDEDKAVAFIMGYEREAEGNEQYPQNTLYISELAVSEQFQNQGIAKMLLGKFFVMNDRIGFQSLSGKLNYSIQTNCADWNEHVVNLYKSFGFTPRATKSYPNRTDLILGMDADKLLSR